MKEIVINCKGIVKGVAEGEALVCKKAFSFMGDVDMDTGEIIAKDHEHYGTSIAGKVLVFPETKGSSGGFAVLTTLAANNRKPKALVYEKMADYNLVEGAILAKVPLVCNPDVNPIEEIKTRDLVQVDAEKGIIKVKANF